MTGPVTPTADRHGVNVICHATASFGLAVAARNTIRTLDDAGIPTAIIDVDSRDGRSGRDTTYADRLGTDAPYSVNLFHLNPPEIVRLLQERPAWLDVSGKVNACVPFWELPRTPEAWSPLLEAMDAVLAPTRFVEGAVRAGAPGAECRHYPQAAYLPDGVRADRPRWNLPEDLTVYLLAFDITSDVDRKNPYAALEAFEQSGLTAEQARLVIKLSNADFSRRLQTTAEKLRARVATDPRITIVDEHLSYADMLSLTASCDALITLHRSEGLGLNLLEAMSLGKAVIGTGWSGNTDFMTAENSVLVPYTLVPVRSEHPAYQHAIVGTDQTWAEPDIEQAADALRRLATEKAFRLAVGQRAHADMDALRTDPARWQPVVTLIEESASVIGSAAHAARAAGLAALKRVPMQVRARRIAAQVLRSLKLRK